MNNFLSDVLRSNILPFLLFHETRRIRRVCTLFNSVVIRSKAFNEPNEKELEQNVRDWMETVSKYRKSSMDILKFDNDTFNTFSFSQRSYLIYFLIFQNVLYQKMPKQFVDLINTRKISIRNASNSCSERGKLINFVCNILEFIRVPISSHLCNCNYLDENYNAALMTINSLDLTGNQLTDIDIISICKAIIRRYKNQKKYTFLKHIILKNNKQITDSSMKILNETLSIYCPFLKSIDLSQTNISNQTCLFINKYLLNPNNNNTSRLIHIKLYDTKIDQMGIQLLSKASNAIKTKIYCDKMGSSDNKRKPQYRNLRDLLKKRRK